MELLLFSEFHHAMLLFVSLSIYSRLRRSYVFKNTMLYYYDDNDDDYYIKTVIFNYTASITISTYELLISLN